VHCWLLMLVSLVLGGRRKESNTLRREFAIAIFVLGQLSQTERVQFLLVVELAEIRVHSSHVIAKSSCAGSETLRQLSENLFVGLVDEQLLRRGFKVLPLFKCLHNGWVLLDPAGRTVKHCALDNAAAQL
jgi:hypothetical protein